MRCGIDMRKLTHHMTTNIALIVFEAGLTFQNWQIAKYLSTDIAHSVNTETETDVV